MAKAKVRWNSTKKQDVENARLREIKNEVFNGTRQIALEVEELTKEVREGRDARRVLAEEVGHLVTTVKYLGEAIAYDARQSSTWGPCAMCEPPDVRAQASAGRNGRHPVGVSHDDDLAIQAARRLAGQAVQKPKPVLFLSVPRTLEDLRGARVTIDREIAELQREQADETDRRRQHPHNPHKFGGQR